MGIEIVDPDEQRLDLSIQLVVEVVKQAPIATEIIERQLDRAQSFIPRVDARVAAFFAILSGQIAFVLINLRASDLTGWFMFACLVWFSGSAVWAMLNIYQCMHPDLENDRTSMIYFVDIGKMSVDEYAERFCSMSESELRKELCFQIWRNSRIVVQKYSSLKRAGSSILSGTVPWSILLFGSSIANVRLPALP